MWHRGLFKRLRKTKGHGAVSMKHYMIGWWCWRRLESASFGAKHSSGVSAWLKGVLQREMRRDEEGWSL